MPPIRVAVLTCEMHRELHPDEQLLARAAAPLGLELIPVVWNRAPLEVLEAFDAVLLRTTWDWPEHRAAFRASLDALARLDRVVLNPPSLLVRFADKGYLRTLAELGLSPVPTEFLSAQSLPTAQEVASTRGWGSVVLKPSFTASAAGAFRCARAELPRVVEAAAALGIEGEWLLQPYLPAITTEGEWSLIFFGGVFSHAVRKRPGAGDFRVQSEHGGSAALAQAPAWLVERARQIVTTAVPEALFARVDGVIEDGQLWVMELEVVEPELFLSSAPDAAHTLAAALDARLKQELGRFR